MTTVAPFILLTIAKLQSQPRCPTAEERVGKMWYIHNGIQFS